MANPEARSGDGPREQARRNTRMRFEQWARNPACEANTLSAVHNVRMAEVAKNESLTPTFGQSPFALRRGESLERILFARQAAVLVAALADAGVLPEAATGREDLRIKLNGGPVANLDSAIAGTVALLERVASARTATERRGLPAVVAGATVRIPRGVMLPEAILILDVLAIRADADLPELIVGEIKTYPDRGGHTDPQELALARAQAGIYLHAIRLVVDTLGLRDAVRISDTGFLVLTKPGSNSPSVRAGEDLRYQAERARRGFELLEKAALALPRIEDNPDNAALTAAVMRAATSYSEACLSFCDRAESCYRNAVERGDAVILGEDVRRFLGNVSLPRAMALLDGARPGTLAEADVLRRIQESERTAHT